MVRAKFIASLFEALQRRDDEAALCWGGSEVALRAIQEAQACEVEGGALADNVLAPHAVVLPDVQRFVARMLPRLSSSSDFASFRRQCVRQDGRPR